MATALTDDAGRSITIGARPARIVTLSPAMTELVFALGRGDSVVATDRSSDTPAAVASLPKVGSYSSPDLEAIVAAAPDLVVATHIHEAKLVPALDERHIPTIVLAATTYDAVEHDVDVLGAALGATAQASELRTTLDASRSAVTSKVSGVAPVRAYVEITPTFMAAGPGTLLDDLVGLAGGTNVASGASTTYPQLTPEAIVTANPDVILLAEVDDPPTVDAVSRRPGFDAISAVRSGRIVALDPSIATRPGPRVGDALELIARALHPDPFR